MSAINREIKGWGDKAEQTTGFIDYGAIKEVK